MESRFAESEFTEREELQNAILRSLDVSFAVLDENGLIVDVSDPWERFAESTGAEPDSIGIGVNYLEACRRAIPKFEAQRVLKGILSVMNGEAPRFSHEYPCGCPDEQRWLVLTVAPHPTVRGGAVIFHRNDPQIKRSELSYNEVLDSVRAILWRAEAPAFNTTFVSGQIEDILGFSADAWTSDPALWEKQLYPEDRNWVLQYRSQEVAARRRHSYEYRIIGANGGTVWLRNMVHVIVASGEVKELVGLSVDVTDRRQAEKERDSLAVRLLRSQEEERSNIARELHDDIGQSIALLAYKLQFLKKRIPPDSEEAAKLKEAHAFTGKIAQDLQRISHGLHSPSLELLGLASAVDQHCREFASNNRAKVQFDIGDIPRNLDGDVALCLFRVLQECLRNVTKHSKAKRVTVSLSMKSNQIQLQVSDDGIGFDPLNEASREGLGLASMSERIRRVHGKLAVAASVGKGTQVTASVPLRVVE